MPSIILADLEEIHSEASFWDIAAGLTLDLVNTQDNDGVSAAANHWRFFGTHIDQSIYYWGPIGAVCALIFLGTAAWFRYKYWDAWESYLEREKEQLKRIRALLKCTEKAFFQRSLSQMSRLAESLQSIAQTLDDYLRSTDKLAVVFEGAIEANIEANKDKANNPDNPGSPQPNNSEKYKEKLACIEAVRWEAIVLRAKVTEQIKFLSSGAAGPLANQVVDDSIDVSTAEGFLTAKQQEGLNDQKKSIEERIKHPFLQFTQSFGFNVPFYWSWSFWFVFFITQWALPAGTALASLPIWGLFTLVFPIVYLMYLEYRSYKVRLTITEAEESQLDANTNPSMYRWGWLFIAVLAGIYVGLQFAATNNPLTGVILGPCVFLFTGAAIALFSFKNVDNRIKEKRKEYAERKANYDKWFKKLENGKQELAQEPSLNRRAWALHRQMALDKIELRCQVLYSRNRIALQELEVCIDKLGGGSTFSRDNSKAELAVAEEKQQDVMPEEKQQDVVDANKKVIPTESYPEFARRVFMVSVSFVMTYMFTALIGFAVMGLLGQVPGIELFSLDQSLGPFQLFRHPVLSFVVGATGIVSGIVTATRVWYEDKNQWITLKLKATEKDYLQKQARLEALRGKKKSFFDYFTAQTQVSLGKIETLRNELRKNLEKVKLILLNAADKRVDTSEKPREKLLRLFPYLEDALDETIKIRRKSLKEQVAQVLLNLFQFITNVSSVLLVARVLLVMSLVGAVGETLHFWDIGFPAFFGFIESSLNIFNPNPLFFAVLTVAMVLWIAKSANELWISKQQEKQLQKMDRIDTRLERAEQEYRFLEEVKSLMDKGNQLKGNHALLEPLEEEPWWMTCITRVVNEQPKAAVSSDSETGKGLSCG